MPTGWMTAQCGRATCGLAIAAAALIGCGGSSTDQPDAADQPVATDQPAVTDQPAATDQLIATDQPVGSAAVPASDAGLDPAAGVTTTAVTVAELFPDVVDVTAKQTAGGWQFDVTLSSPYDTPERYADAWRIVGDDGVVYGVRELTHDHAGEQPFTRSLSGVDIPESVTSVTIEGRDQRSGWGGATIELALDRS